ncbi:hypothetical protein GW17_00061156 [Ensete ventricosum]|nr:hypothetical protein GW17_00061156 [Ensete ventricosum]
MRRRDSKAWPDHVHGGDRLQPRPPCKGVAGCGQAPCKGRPPAEAATRKGRFARGQPCRLCSDSDGGSGSEKGGKERARASF